jgi:hypothetical protein
MTLTTLPLAIAAMATANAGARDSGCLISPQCLGGPAAEGEEQVALLQQSSLKAAAEVRLHAQQAEPGLQDVVDRLNEMYFTGKASNNASEVGVTVHLLDGLSDYVDGYDLTNATPAQIFDGSSIGGAKLSLAASVLNWNVSAPSNNNSEIAIFPSWIGWGPPMGMVYTPCIVDDATQCSYAQSPYTDQRAAGRCSRIDPSLAKWPSMRVNTSSKSCIQCISFAALPAENNTVTGKSLTIYDDLPQEANLPNAEIELLFNRFNNINPGPAPGWTKAQAEAAGGREIWASFDYLGLPEACVACLTEGGMPDDCVSSEMCITEVPAQWQRFYEAPGYYGNLPNAASGSPEPENQLQDMLALHAGVYAQRFVNTPPDTDGGNYNEVDVNTAKFNTIEQGRSFDTDWDGRQNGECRAAVSALVRICGKQDKFFVDQPGTCLDFVETYMEYYKTDKAPPLVWMRLDNATHPFSTSCDSPVSKLCGIQPDPAV